MTAPEPTTVAQLTALDYAAIYHAAKLVVGAALGVAGVVVAWMIAGAVDQHRRRRG